jgi:Rad3-related DNA helicase
MFSVEDFDSNVTREYNYTVTTAGLDADHHSTEAHIECIPWNDEVELSNSSDESYASYRVCDRDPPEFLKWYVEAQTALDFVLIFIVPMAIIAALYCKTAHTLVTSGTLERGNSADRLRRKRTHAAR